MVRTSKKNMHHPYLALTVPEFNGAIGGRKKKVVRIRGEGFFGDVWDGIKSVGKVILPVANDMLKKSGLVSSGLSMIPGVGGIASNIAKSQGYGKKKKVKLGAPVKKGGKRVSKKTNKTKRKIGSGNIGTKKATLK